MSKLLQDHTMEAPSDYWFINSLVSFVADEALTEGSFSIVRQVAPPGFATPYHMHEAYSEGFCVLTGEVKFFCDGKKTALGDGGFIYLPGTLPHGFRVNGNNPAAMMIVSSPGSTFSPFVREMGEPAPFHALPVASPPDVARLGALSAKHGSSILGPLPG